MNIYLFTSSRESNMHYLYDDVEGYIIVYREKSYYNSDSYSWKWSTDLDIYNDNPVDNVELEFELPYVLLECQPIINDGDLHKALCDRIEQLIFDKIQ